MAAHPTPRLPPSPAARPPASLPGRSWVMAGVLGLIAGWCGPSLAAPRPAPGRAQPAALPPHDLLASWQPLRPHALDQTLKRPELVGAVRAHTRRNYLQACLSVEKVRAGLLKQAATLFYKPVRQGADIEGMDHFMKRHVRGPSPLLQLAGEVFVPSAPLRSLGVDACVRARRPELAERFVAQAAGASGDPLLGLSLAVARLQRGLAPTQVVWLVGAQGGGAGASLLRALASQGPERRRHLEAADRSAGTRHRALVDDLGRWMKEQSP